MKAITAKDAKNNFGELIDTAQREPVTIQKHGRAVAVVLSAREYKELKQQQFKSEAMKGINQLDRGEKIDGDIFFDHLLQK